MRTEQEERDEYLLRSSIEYPEFVSKITLENLVFQEVIDNAIFSSEGIQLEKVRLGKGEFVKQRDGSTQFVEFENSTVGNQLSVQQELERQRTNEKEEHDGHYCFSLIGINHYKVFGLILIVYYIPLDYFGLLLML